MSFESMTASESFEDFLAVVLNGVSMTQEFWSTEEVMNWSPNNWISMKDYLKVGVKSMEVKVYSNKKVGKLFLWI
jgi:hypothetical protein